MNCTTVRYLQLRHQESVWKHRGVSTMPVHFSCADVVELRWFSTAVTFVVLLQLRQQGRLTWDCQNELFRQEVEGADDIRLNAPLVSKCMSDTRTFCADVAPGMHASGPPTLFHILVLTFFLKSNKGVTGYKKVNSLWVLFMFIYCGLFVVNTQLPGN